MQELYDIIQNMGKEEKREFKLFVNAYEHSKEAYYVKLFDYLEKSPRLDLKHLQAKADRHEFGRQFNITKQKLWDHLLNSLIISRRHKNYNRSLHHEVSQIEVLVENNCYKTALRRFNKAYKEAVRNEQLQPTLRLHFIYCNLVVYAFSSNEPYDIEILGEPATTLLEKMKYFFHFNYTKEKIKKALLGAQTDPRFTSRDEEVEYLKKEMLEPPVPDKYHVIQSEFFRYTSYALLHSFYHDSAELEKISKDVMQIIDKKPHIKNDNLRSYLTIVISLLTALMEQRKWEEFDERIREADRIFQHDKVIKKIYQPTFTKFRYFKAYYTLHEREKEYYADELMALVQSKEKSIPVHQYAETFLIIIKYLCEKKDYRKALIYMNWLRNDVSREMKEVHSVNFFYFLLAHFELKNEDVLYTQLENFKKELTRSDDMGRSAYHLFKSLLDSTSAEDVKKHKKQWWMDIQPLNRVLFDRYFEVFAIDEWVYS